MSSNRPIIANSHIIPRNTIYSGPPSETDLVDDFVRFQEGEVGQSALDEGELPPGFNTHTGPPCTIHAQRNSGLSESSYSLQQWREILQTAGFLFVDTRYPRWGELVKENIPKYIARLPEGRFACPCQIKILGSD